jgi:UDP-N-acetylmuramoylalanine--D-glutamate ligase
MIRVLGKGLTAQALKDKFDEVVLYDDKDFDKYDLESNDITVVSPGIPPSNNMVQKAKNIQSDYDLFASTMPYSIWISGTNGKTTTTQMMQHLLEKYNSQAGGNIGLPISSMDESKKIWILETSSFTLHYTNIAKPNIYILLPISEDHLSWHGSFEEYKKSKIKPVLSMNEGEVAIVPEEFKDIKTNAYLITYKNSDELCEVFDIDKSKIRFNEPFLMDAILALASKKILFDHVDYEKINTYTVDKHKVEELRDSKNRIWINDSKATNVDAVVNCLVPYNHKNIHLILGGDDKGANMEVLFENIKDLDIEIYCIGTNTNKLIKLASKYNIKANKCNDLALAVKLIKKNLKENSIGILSPAAASLDQFTSYSQRGNEFKNLVQS